MGTIQSYGRHRTSRVEAAGRPWCRGSLVKYRGADGDIRSPLTLAATPSAAPLPVTMGKPRSILAPGRIFTTAHKEQGRNRHQSHSTTISPGRALTLAPSLGLAGPSPTTTSHASALQTGLPSQSNGTLHRGRAAAPPVVLAAATTVATTTSHPSSSLLVPCVSPRLRWTWGSRTRIPRRLRQASTCAVTRTKGDRLGIGLARTRPVGTAPRVPHPDQQRHRHPPGTTWPAVLTLPSSPSHSLPPTASPTRRTQSSGRPLPCAAIRRNRVETAWRPRGRVPSPVVEKAASRSWQLSRSSGRGGGKCLSQA